MSVLVHKSKNTDFSPEPPYQMVEQLKTKNSEIERLTEKCGEMKKKVWELKASKEWLLEQSAKSMSQQGPDLFLAELKEKYERSKGTKLEKSILGLLKAYEKYSKQATALRVLNKEKGEILQAYKKVTTVLSQESNLKNKIGSLQEFSEEKDKTTNELEEKLRSIRKETQDLKVYLDSCEVKRLLESKEQIIEEREKYIEDQKVLLIELSKIDQTIELEKNINKITPDLANQILKKNIADAESLVADAARSLKLKEKQRETLKIQISKLDKKPAKSVQSSRIQSKSASSTPKSVKSGTSSFQFSLLSATI
jgi:hypothetical protein